MSDLFLKKSKSIKNFFWSFSQQFSLKIVAFVVQIILARILLPEDFGLIAIITVFISIGQSLSDGGMRSSLIRTVDADKRDYSTVFFINVILSLIIYLIIYFLAPYISVFYNSDKLTLLIRVLSLSFIIKSLNIVQSTIVVKELNFKKIFSIQLPASMISAIVGVALAYMGYGVWSLVFMTLTESLVNTVLYWLTSKWKPMMFFKKEIYFKHFNFGYKLTIASVLNAIFQNIYTIIIGKIYTPATVGLYNRADSFSSFPVRMSITSIKSVTYPMLSRLGDNDEKLKESYRQIMLQMIFWITPLLLLMFLNAENLFSIILTDKWNAAVPFFKILCIAFIFYPLQEYNLQVLDIKGRSDIYLKIELIKKVITVVVLAIALNFSIIYLLYSQVLLNIIFFVLGALISGKMINYKLKEQFTDIFYIFLINGVIWMLIIFFQNNFDLHNRCLNVLLTSIMFMLAYFIVSWFFKVEPLIHMITKIYGKR